MNEIPSNGPHDGEPPSSDAPLGNEGPLISGPETPEPPGRSQATNWLLAAILLVLVAITAVLVFNNSDSADTASTEPGAVTSTTVVETTTTEAGTTTEAETTTTVAETTTSVAETTTTTTAETTTTIGELTDETATEAVMSWIEAINAGDSDTAYDLVAPESQTAFGGRQGFDGSFSALQEGFGAWAEASGVYGEGDPWVFVNEIDDDTRVVTLAGTVSQEGSDGQRAAAIPVVIRDGKALVQPFLRGGTIEFINPIVADTPPVLDFDPQFEVIIPGAPDVRMFVFTTEADLTLTDLGNDTTQVVSDPFGNVEVGGISVLTVFYTEDDVVHADAVLFQVGESS